MATQLAKTLRTFYSREGNRIIFQNGMTLNQLALEMWERLGYQEIDASALSRILSGERLFTPNQLEIFSKILNLSKSHETDLRKALIADYFERHGLDISFPIPLIHKSEKSAVGKVKESDKAVNMYTPNIDAKSFLEGIFKIPLPEELKPYASVEGSARTSGKFNTYNVGIILPKFYPRYEEVVLPILKDELERRGFDWSVTYSAESPFLFLRQFWLFSQKLKLAGLIVLPPPSGAWTKALERSVDVDFPLVCIDRSFSEHSKFPSIKPTHFEGSNKLVKQLIKRRFKKVVLIDGDSEIEAYRKRAQGYEAAMEKPGVSKEKVLLKEGKFGLWKSVPSDEKIEKFIRRKSRKERIAFFAVNSARAKLIYHLATQIFGKWPENWALAHFDGLDESGLKNGEFFAAEQDKETIVEEAVRLLVRKFNKLPIDQPVDLVPTKFVRA